METEVAPLIITPSYPSAKTLLCSSKLMKPKKRVMGTSDLYSQSVRSTDDCLALGLVSEGDGVWLVGLSP